MTKNMKAQIGEGRKGTVAHGVGRRKKAVARVFLRYGSGVVTVNGTPANEYFDTEIARLAVQMPFKVYPETAMFDIDANVNGGGLHGQADAVKLGIARALLKVRDDARAVLKKNGLLTVDDRIKERKKYGKKAARRSFQFVKR